MNKARSLAMGIALGVAFVAVMFVKNSLNRPAAPVIVKQKISKVKVLVAAKDIAVGDKVTRDQLAWRDWPENGTEGFISNKVKPMADLEMVGRVARSPISKGDPIREKRLVKPGTAGVMSVMLPAGKRAISIDVQAQAQDSGIILPGDRVDLVQVLTHRDRITGKETVVSKTMLEDIKVLAMSSTLQQNDKDKTMSGKRTATLELTPRQVEVVAAAKSKGDLLLSLRSVADANKKRVDEEEAPVATSSIKILRYGVVSSVTVEE